MKTKRVPSTGLLIFCVIIVVLLFFTKMTQAATVYVSNSASNEYSLGSDSNSYVLSQNKATPKLSLTSAISAAVAGDTIVLNNGTYVEPGIIIIGKALTINGESDYGVTLQVTGTPTYLVAPTVGGVTLGKVIVDAQNIANEILHPGAFCWFYY